MLIFTHVVCLLFVYLFVHEIEGLLRTCNMAWAVTPNSFQNRFNLYNFLFPEQRIVGDGDVGAWAMSVEAAASASAPPSVPQEKVTNPTQQSLSAAGLNSASLNSAESEI